MQTTTTMPPPQKPTRRIRLGLIAAAMAFTLVVGPGIVAEAPLVEDTAIADLLADDAAAAASWEYLWPGKFTGQYISGYPLYCVVSHYSGWGWWRKPVYDQTRCSLRGYIWRGSCRVGRELPVNLVTGWVGSWRDTGVVDCR